MEKLVAWGSEHTPNFMMGAVAGISAYFAPIKGVVAIVMLAILIDLVLGILAARTRGEGIKSEKLWRTVYKMLITFAIIHLMYSIDVEFGIEGMRTYKIVGLFIVGFELWSILENAAVITDHRVFRIIRHYMEDKVKATTGIDMDEKKKDDEKGTINN